MISAKEFIKLGVENKKKVLLTVFSQLPIKSSEIQEVQDLLQLDFAYHANTLDSIYASMCDVVEKWTQSDVEKISKQAHRAHELLEKDAIESASEADDILNAI